MTAHLTERAASDWERQLALLMHADKESRARRMDAESLRRAKLKKVLRQAGLRPTRQRIVLAGLLFSGGDRHLTAEMLHAEARAATIQVSLATVYNALHQFTKAGLLREIGIEGTKTFFDTNPSAHHHFVVEGGEALFDIPEEGLALDALPPVPDGFSIARVDVIVRLRRKSAEPAAAQGS